MTSKDVRFLVSKRIDVYIQDRLYNPLNMIVFHNIGKQVRVEEIGFQIRDKIVEQVRFQTRSYVIHNLLTYENR